MPYFAKPTASIAEVSKKHKVSDQTLHGWRKRFGQLEAENGKLKAPMTHQIFISGGGMYAL